MFRQLSGRGVRSNFAQLARLSIDQRGSTELGVKNRYLRKPKFFLRAKNAHGRYLGWRSEKKNIQDGFDLMFHNISTFLTQKKIDNPSEIPTSLFMQHDAVRYSPDKDHFTWLGHSTCYVQIHGKFFLTDPIWSRRASPLKHFGPMRIVPPPIPLEDLRIDYVLLSHTHYDHFDEVTARRIGNQAKWIVPLGVKIQLESIGITNAVELDWWQTYLIPIPKHDETPIIANVQVKGKGKRETKEEEELRIKNLRKDSNHKTLLDNIEVVFTPTQHWSSRTIIDRKVSIWGSFSLLSPRTRFFFTGDTAYCSVFKDVGELFGPFDLAAIPIGAYKPRQYLKDVHCDPGEAVQIHKDLKAIRSAAIHWGTYDLSEEDFLEPALELARVRQLQNIDSSIFFTMAHGETLPINQSSPNDLATLYPNLLDEYVEFFELEDRITAIEMESEKNMDCGGSTSFWNFFNKNKK